MVWLSTALPAALLVSFAVLRVAVHSDGTRDWLPVAGIGALHVAAAVCIAPAWAVHPAYGVAQSFVAYLGSALLLIASYRRPPQILASLCDRAFGVSLYSTASALTLFLALLALNRPERSEANGYERPAAATSRSALFRIREAMNALEEAIEQEVAILERSQTALATRLESLQQEIASLEAYRDRVAEELEERREKAVQDPLFVAIERLIRSGIWKEHLWQFLLGVASTGTFWIATRSARRFRRRKSDFRAP